MIALILSLSGCERKTQIINKCEIPQSLLSIPMIDTEREIKTQSDTALFLLDIYEAYEKCSLNLQSIKRLILENKRDDEY